MSTFNIANPIYIVNRSSNVDSRYGPWSSIGDANSNINLNIREIGLTVGVSAVGVGVTEYWYKNGTQNTDLVLKTTGGGGGSADLSIFYNISSSWTSSTNTVCALSANWNSVYSNVNQNSALWNGFNTYTSNFLISGGNSALILNTSANNVFFRAVNSGQLFSYTNFTTGKTIIVYLSAAHADELIHQFPIGTYFTGVGDSNYVLTYEGKITKATISNIQNNFLGFSEIIETQYENQTIPRDIFDDNILLDGYIGFLLQEDTGRIIPDDTLIPPPFLQICVQTPNPLANGTYQFFGHFKGRPAYHQAINGNEVHRKNYGSVNNRWELATGGGPVYYITNSDTYLPTDASWPINVNVSVGPC
jgi:hypothetical protein